MSEDKQSIYSDILVSGDSLDRELLARTAMPFIRIYADGEKAEIVFKPETQKMTNRQKLLVYLLGRKILMDLEKLNEEEEEGVTPSEMEEATHISGGSIRPVLAGLLKERLVQKDDSRYYVPNYSIAQVAEELEEK